MNACELAEKLNSIAQYELVQVGRSYETLGEMAKQGEWGGEWIKVSDVARVLGLTIEYGQNYGKFQSP